MGEMRTGGAAKVVAHGAQESERPQWTLGGEFWQSDVEQLGEIGIQRCELEDLFPSQAPDGGRVVTLGVPHHDFGPWPKRRSSLPLSTPSPARLQVLSAQLRNELRH